MALSLCGGLESNGPTDEEFEKHLIDYADVCQNPSIFMSPLLVVRLCDKYYSWATASSIVMTIIAYRKPLTNVSESENFRLGLNFLKCLIELVCLCVWKWTGE